MIHANDERLQRLLMGQERFLQEVHGILAEEEKKDDVLRAVVRSAVPRAGINRIARLDPERVFHIASIRRQCVKYRLRFLDAGRFQGDLPPRALYELRRMEARSAAQLRGFKVMAPASRFKRCDSDADPLLFVPVGPEHYYLVHKWGGDLRWYRAALAWPLRDARRMSLAVLGLALMGAALLPTALFTSAPEAGWWGGHRVLALLWSGMVAGGLTVLARCMLPWSYSTEAWNNERFN